MRTRGSLMKYVQKECERLGVLLPPHHEHSYKEDVLIREEAEYELANRLFMSIGLCGTHFPGPGVRAGKARTTSVRI